MSITRAVHHEATCLPSPDFPWAYYMAPVHAASNFEAMNLKHNKKPAHHVPSSLYRRKRQPLRTPRHTRLRAADIPRAQGLSRELYMPSPLECARPHFVPNMIADPVILAYIYQHAHPALEERGNVVLRWAEFIHVRGERQVDGDAVGRERLCDGRIDAELRANFGAV